MRGVQTYFRAHVLVRGNGTGSAGDGIVDRGIPVELEPALALAKNIQECFGRFGKWSGLVNNNIAIHHDRTLLERDYFQIALGNILVYAHAGEYGDSVLDSDQLLDEINVARFDEC